MKIVQILAGTIAIATVFNACKKDDPPLPDNLVQFEAGDQGFDATATESTVKIKLSRAADVATTIKVSLTASGITYATHFTTEPAATGDVITLPVAVGATEASFKVKPVAGTFLSGSETVKFTITDVSPLFIGTIKELNFKFGAIVSTGSTAFTLEGKTTESNYFNSVYLDLSNNQSTLAPRKSWNIGLYNGDAFRVVINPGYQSTAKALAKTDIAEVGFADTVGIQLNHDPSDVSTSALVDNWDGSLTKTAFAEVSATDAENKVYLLSFEGNKTQDKYLKVKVTRNGAGYKVQYAKVGETTIKTIDITKNAAYNFTFASLETDKVVTVEPQKNNWDIQWGYSTSDAGAGAPYWYQDFIAVNNVGGASAAEVLESTVTYAAFTESNVAAVTFLNTRDAIGSKWRVTSGATVGIKKDRFYVVKDPLGNVYKLRFVSMGVGTDGGERGKPVVEYALVKKA
jgi:hypothetical protein